MTNSNRFIRGLVEDPRCKGCLDGEETAMHLLRDCKFAKEIWEQLIPTGSHALFYTLPLRTWIKTNIQAHTPCEENWPTIFFVAHVVVMEVEESSMLRRPRIPTPSSCMVYNKESHGRSWSIPGTLPFSPIHSWPTKTRNINPMARPNWGLDQTQCWWSLERKPGAFRGRRNLQRPLRQVDKGLRLDLVGAFQWR